MEAIRMFAPKTGSHQLSLSTRTHLYPISKFSSFPLPSCPRKPGKLVRLKAASSVSCDDRKFEKFPPSEWTYRFNSATVDYSEMDMLRREINTLKQKVKNTLMSSQGKKRILMIYLLESLGLAYHFEDEIEDSLKEGFEKIQEMIADEDDLYTISIMFWVLRTYRHEIFSDVFRRFKGNNGKFKESLVGDARGMLALYEATHLATTEDDILDEALSFTRNHLDLLATYNACPSHLSAHIKNALRLSQHKNMRIVVVVQYITFYEKEEDHDKTLLNFAKINFNLMQIHYLEELKILTKWFKDQDFASNLPPYYRCEIVQTHFFIISMFMEPKLSHERMMVSKLFTAMLLVDDIYDRYSSPPEAESLAKSLKMWAPDDTMERQPNYLKFVFKYLEDTFQDFEREITSKLGTSNSLEAIRKEFNMFVKGNHDFAKWAQAGHLPSFEEYMEVGEIEVGMYMVMAGIFMAMGVDHKVYEWLQSRPKIVQRNCKIVRLLNDIVGFEHDMRRGDIGSINCYMKQYGVGKEEAIREVRKIVAWSEKVMNEEFLKESNVSTQILNQVFNLLRTFIVAYNEGEGLTYFEGGVGEYITSVFVNKIRL